MNIKICKFCNKEFNKDDFLKKIDRHGHGSWHNKKYCSDECRLAYRKSLNKNMLKNTYHDNLLLKINEEVNGRINITQNKIDSENPDIETESANYELEVFSNYHKWINKYARKKDNKKHILIISSHPKLKRFFDEIRFI